VEAVLTLAPASLIAVSSEWCSTQILNVIFPGCIRDVLLSDCQLASNLYEPSAGKHDQETDGGYPVAYLEPNAMVTNPGTQPRDGSDLGWCRLALK
jgi:hypothetical protein